MVANLDENVAWRKAPLLTALEARSFIAMPLDIERTAVGAYW